MTAIGDQSDDIQKAYKVLSEHLKKHKKEQELCLLFTNSDLNKNAFIKRETIEKCLIKIAPKIKQ